jgi:hypothetical protein
LLLDVAIQEIEAKMFKWIGSGAMVEVAPGTNNTSFKYVRVT